MRPVTYSLFVIFGCFAVVNAAHSATTTTPAALIKGGIRLNNKEAAIALGPHGDVRISRRGPGKLNIDGNVKFSGLVRVLKGVKIDGVTLEKYIEMRVIKALNPGPPSLEEICKGVKSILPFSLDSTLPDAVNSLLPVRVDEKKSVPENIFGVLSSLLGNETSDMILSQPVDKLLPIPLDTSKSLPETVDTILKMLNLPVNTTENLPEVLISLLPLLPLDESKTLSETVASLMPLLLGANSTDQVESILKQRIGDFLPIPLDTSKSLPETVDTILNLFQLPVNTSESIPQALIALLAVLPLDQSKSLPETISALLPLLLGANSTDQVDHILRQRIGDLMPLQLDGSLPEAVDSLLKMLNLPINTTESIHEAIVALLPLLPLDKRLSLSETIIVMVSSFLGANSTESEVVDNLLKQKIAKLLPLPFDTSKTLVENIIPMLPLLLPFGNMTLADMSDRLPDAVGELLKILPLPNDVNKMLAEIIAGMMPTLWKDLPLDKSMTVPQTIATLVPMLLGNMSTTVPMSKLLPLPLDTSKTLPENMDTMLHIFGLPVDTTKEGVLDVLAGLSKVLPFDQSHSVPEAIVSLLPMLLGINSTDEINHILTESIANMFSLDASKTLPENVDTLLKLLQLPVNTSESLHTALATLLPLLPLDKTQPMSVTIASMLPMLLGVNDTEQINQMMTMGIGKFLPVPLDTNKNLAENVDTILKMLDLPISTDEHLPDAIAALINKLPVDKTKTATETIVSLIPMFMGINATDVIENFLESSIGSMLPLPLDTSKSLGDTISAMLPVLLPIPNITTASLSKTVEMLLGAMDVDADVLASNTMAALLKEMLQEMAKDNTVREAVSKILPKNQTKELMKIVSKNKTLSQMAKDLSSKLPVNSTSQLVSKTIHQLLPGDTGNVLADMIASFLGLNETHHLASIINFDPNRPISELMPNVMGILQRCDKDIFG